MVVTISEEEYSAHREDYDGLCLACGEWTTGGVEPDAEKRRCEGCGARRVVGAENAVLRGAIELGGE